MKNILFALLAFFMTVAPAFAENAPAAPAAAPTAASDLENTLYLDLKDGRVVIQLRPDLAPKHVERIKELVRKGFYDGLSFHRVIEGFMAQGGDPTGTGTSGSGQNIVAEFSPEPFVRGTVGMARSQSPNSADSQFFICFGDAQFLNGQYTVWGKVTSGMEFVDKITRGEPPANPDKIVKMQIASDVKADTKETVKDAAPAKEEKAAEKPAEKKAEKKKAVKAKAVEKKAEAPKAEEAVKSSETTTTTTTTTTTAPAAETAPAATAPAAETTAPAAAPATAAPAESTPE